MTQRISDTLGITQIRDLIESPGDFLAEVKRALFSQAKPDKALAGLNYSMTGFLLQYLKGEDALRQQLRDLFIHLPRLSLPEKKSTQPLAAHELFLIKQFLYHHNRLKRFLDRQGWDKLTLPPLERLFGLLDPEGSGLPAFRIGEAFSEKLAQISKQRQQLALKLKQARRQLLEDAREVLRLPQLKEEFLLSRSQSELAEKLSRSGYFLLASENIANVGFALADDQECLWLKQGLSQLEEQREKEEARILKRLSGEIYKELKLLRLAWHQDTILGLNFILAQFALDYDCCIPTLWRKRQILITGARNLPLQLHLEAAGRQWQSFDYSFNQPVSLITGPNMGGKTTVLKTVGQFCWLARLGVPLPCAEARLPLFDQIWYNQEDEDAGSDLSSFGREVVSFVEALRQDGLTLFLLDEFAKGTNPNEGEALATAVLQYLATTQQVCIAATHYTGPALLRNLAQYSVAGLDPESEALRRSASLSPNQRLQALGKAMDYRLVRLSHRQAPPLNAIAVARILGLPDAILDLIPKEQQ